MIVECFSTTAAVIVLIAMPKFYTMHLTISTYILHQFLPYIDIVSFYLFKYGALIDSAGMPAGLVLEYQWDRARSTSIKPQFFMLIVIHVHELLNKISVECTSRQLLQVHSFLAEQPVNSSVLVLNLNCSEIIYNLFFTFFTVSCNLENTSYEVNSCFCICFAVRSLHCVAFISDELILSLQNKVVFLNHRNLVFCSFVVSFNLFHCLQIFTQYHKRFTPLGFSRELKEKSRGTLVEVTQTSAAS